MRNASGAIVSYIWLVKRLDAPLSIEVEILGEKAQALGRTARAFEQELERLRAFEKRVSALSLSERAKLEPEHEALRKRASRRFWFLIVHREAMGLRRHDDLYHVYQIPRSLVPNP
jgi:hypothetical protein